MYTRAFAILFFLFLFVPISTYAKKTISNADSALNTVADRAGVSKSDVSTVSGQVIKNGLQVTGLIFFILMVYAGIRWMLARGNEDQVTTARRTIIYASIGLVVVAGSYSLTSFVTDRVIEGNASSKSGFIDDKDADFSVLGCCLDQVRYPTSWGELRATTWGWRITSKSDCREQGEKPNSFDEVYGADKWEFFEVDSKEQCAARYALFCRGTSCYNLGWE